MKEDFWITYIIVQDIMTNTEAKTTARELDWKFPISLVDLLFLEGFDILAFLQMDQKGRRSYKGLPRPYKIKTGTTEIETAQVDVNKIDDMWAAIYGEQSSFTVESDNSNLSSQQLLSLLITNN